MKKFIAFSGGVESTTLCVLYGHKANAIFADTGYEHDKLYQRLDKIEKKIQDFHKCDFKIIRLTSKHGSLTDYIRKERFYPSFHARYCTRMFKIEPIDDYLCQHEAEGVELMIGLNADEIAQRTGNHGNLPFVKYSYPLADLGITRKKCEDILNSISLHPEFPAYMKRGGCVGCFYKSRSEYEAMIRLAPAEFDKVMELEEEIQDERKEYYAIKKEMGPLRQFKENVLSQDELFNFDQIYATVNNATNCGVFCNR